MTVASCIFIVIFSVCIATNIDFILTELEKTVGISAYIDDALTTDEVNGLRDEILEIDGVSEVEYISAQEALEDMAQTFGGDNPDIIMGLEKDNPLRRSFTITVGDIRSQGEVIAALKSDEMQARGIAKVREAEAAVDVLIAADNIIRAVSFVIILVLGLLSIIIITNTIKLTVNSRRNEIRIMKYIGATDWFVKWPFVIEGIIIGVFGSALPVGVGVFGYDRLIGAIASNSLIVDSIFIFRNSGDIFPTLTPLMLGLGAAIGVVGSVSSLKKHLRA